LRLIATQPLHEKAWFVVSNCILLATFATTIWLGISQRRADEASVSMAQMAADANTIAEQSLQVADESETTAIEALNQISASNNISATNNNNAGYQEWLVIEQYCATHPLVRKIKPPVRNKPKHANYFWMQSNFTFTNATGKYNCSQILNTSISLPVPCGDSGSGVDSCSSAGKGSGTSSVGIAVGVSLSVIIILASISFWWRRRRTNKRILGRSGTTEI
jgi:hypothetical protein